MVVRDIDALLNHSRSAGCTIYMSVPTVDEEAWRALEPGTAPPLQRLRAVRQLTEAGVSVGVLMAPIVPGFSSSRSKVERTLKAIADHGARFIGCNVMHLQDGTRSHFMKFLEKEFPSMLPRMEKLYAAKHPPEAYRKEVQAMVRTLQERYGLAGRPRTVDQEPKVENSPGAEQVAFRW